MLLQREVERVKILEDMKAVDSVKSHVMQIDNRLENFPDRNPSTAYAAERMPSRKKLKVYYYFYNI